MAIVVRLADVKIHCPPAQACRGPLFIIIVGPQPAVIALKPNCMPYMITEMGECDGNFDMGMVNILQSSQTSSIDNEEMAKIRGECCS